MRKIIFIFLSILSVSFLSGQTHVPSAVKLTSVSDLGNMIIYRNRFQLPLKEPGGLLQYSALDTSYPGAGNLRLNLSPFSSNYRVDYRSPAYNRGNNTLLRTTDSLDLDYRPRISCQQLDMGAYEYQIISTKINRSPVPIRVCEGLEASFSVVSEGENLSYQWQRNGMNLLGRTSSVLTFPSVAISDTAYYRVIVIGSCCQDTSAAVRLDVDLRPSILAMNDTSIISGESVILRYLSAVGTVTWYDSDRKTILQDTLLSDISNSRKIFAVAKNGVCADSAVEEVNVTVAGLPCVVKTKEDTTLCLGESYQLLIDSTSTVADYRWFIQGSETFLAAGIFVRPQDTIRFVVEGVAALGQVCRDTLQINIRKLDFQVSDSVKTQCGTVKGYADIYLSSVPMADLWTLNGLPLGSENRYFQQSNHTNEEYVASYFDGYCTKTDTMRVYVNPPNIYALTSDTTICLGDGLHLETNIEPKFVSWDLDGVLLENNPYVFPSDTCVYRAVAYDSLCGNVEAFVRVNVNSPPILLAMEDTVLCQGSHLLLNSSPNASYWMTWEGLRLPDNLIIVTDTLQYIAFLRDGVCTATDTMLVYGVSKPDFRVMQDTTLVLGSSVNLLSSPSATYWQDTITGVMFSGLGLVPDSSTVYKGVLETQYCGQLEDYVKITIVLPSDSLVLSFGLELGCINGEAIVWAIVRGGTYPYTYVWSTGSTDSVLRNQHPGEYHVRVNDQVGSQIEGLVRIDSVLPMSIVLQGIDPRDADCRNGEIQTTILNGFPPYLYYWSDGSMDSNLLSVGSGEYTLRVEDARACEAEKSVLLQCIPGFNLPNLYLSPNGDGMNDYLKIPDVERYPINELIIISLYNKEVISFKNYNNTSVLWDGRNRQGALVPSGTYYVVFKAAGIEPMLAWVYVNLGATK